MQKSHFLAEYPKAVYEDIQFEIDRESIAKSIKNRTFEEKVKLYIRRSLSAFINLVVLIAGLYGLILLQEREAAIGLYFKTVPVLG